MGLGYLKPPTSIFYPKVLSDSDSLLDSQQIYCEQIYISVS
jgi:hypothetical protein